jgi:sortase A
MTQRFTDGRPTHRARGVLRALQWIFVITGLAALGWCAYVLIDAAVYQHVAREAVAGRPSAIWPFDGLAVPDTTPGEAKIAAGAPLAEMEIPRLHFSATVLAGSDDDTLRRGPGHIEQTAWPGQSGNIGIAGHRDTFFRPLRNVRVGDEVLLFTERGRSVYRVSSLKIVQPTDVSVLDPTLEPALTLVTCYPFYFLGSAPLRYIVRAERIDDKAAPTTAADDTPDDAPATPVPATYVEWIAQRVSWAASRAWSEVEQLVKWLSAATRNSVNG